MTIDVKNYSKIIKGITILNNINLHLESGKIYGFIGKNGSGKTMLLRAIAGLISPTMGELEVDGKNLSSEFLPNVGIFIEKPTFLPYLSGFENLKYLAEIKGSITDDTIRMYMEMLFLDSTSKKPFRKYSQGMKQKIGIIQAIMEQQTVLILDEAFNALDEDSVKVLHQWILSAKEDGKLIVLTSHNKEDIYALCDLTYLIKEGGIEA